MLTLYTSSCEILRLDTSTGNRTAQLADRLSVIYGCGYNTYDYPNLPLPSCIQQHSLSRPNYPPSPGPRPRPGPVYPPPDVPTPPDSPRYMYLSAHTVTLFKEGLFRQVPPGDLVFQPHGPSTRPDPPTPPPYPNPGPINPPPDVPTPPEYHSIANSAQYEQPY